MPRHTDSGANATAPLWRGRYRLTSRGPPALARLTVRITEMEAGEPGRAELLAALSADAQTLDEDALALARPREDVTAGLHVALGEVLEMADLRSVPGGRPDQTTGRPRNDDT